MGNELVGRRAFLSWSTSAVAGVACQSSSRPAAPTARVSATPARAPRVVVVGAGLAGLAAALELVEKKFEVTVLEAQERAGGRILTIRRPFRSGLHVEAGATHVVPDPELLALFEKLGVALSPGPKRAALKEVEYLAGQRRVLEQGDEPTPSQTLHADEEALGWDGRLERYFAGISATDPRHPGWPPAELVKLDRVSVATHLKAQGASAGYIASIGEDLCASGDPDAESALGVYRHIACIFQERRLTGAGGRIAGGSDHLPNALAARLRDNLIYGAEAKAIVASDGLARVQFVRRGVSERLEADFVICAVPSPVLGRIDFHPALSAEKRRAVVELPFASVTRIYLECDRRFWSERGESGRASTDLGIGSIREETALQSGVGGILGAYLTGVPARRFGRMREPERIASALKDAELAFPGMREHFIAGASKHWDEDAYARGAYAWHKPDQLTRFGRVVGTAEGRIHFAGDHTSYRPGFMHGALASAKRVVAEIEVAHRTRVT